MKFIKSSLFMNIFFLITISFSFNYIKASSEIDTLPGIRLSTQEEISNYLKTSDLTTLIFYYKTSSDLSQNVAKNLKIVYSKLQYLTEFILVNCDNNYKDECKTINGNIDEIHFFRLELYIPPEYKFNPYT